MELFNYYDSFVIDILMSFFAESETEEDLIDLFKKAFGDNYKEFLGDNPKAFLSMFKQNNGEYVPLFDYNPTILLNNIEKQAISSAIQSPSAIYFLSESEIEQLKEIFNINEIASPFLNRFKQPNPLCNQNNINIILQAISSQYSIIFDNNTHNKTFTNQLGYPMRLEFTPNNNLWTVTIYAPEEDRFINMNVNRLSNIFLKNKIDNLSEIEQKYIQFLTKFKKKIAILKLKGQNYDIDRFFRMLSFYNRHTTYNTKLNEYTVELEYYSFDEQQLIMNILSFGSLITVISPIDLQNKIINEI